MNHTTAMHRRYRSGQTQRHAAQLTRRQWHLLTGQADPTHVFQHDRIRVLVAVSQLHDTRHATQPLQHTYLMPQPPVAVRTQ